MQPHRRPRKMSPTSLMPSVAMILAIVLLASPMSVAWAQDNTGHDQIHSATPTQFGIGAASVLLSIPYGAAKVTYAALGGLIGGFAYLFSAGDTDAAKAVWTPSLQGTYVLTPDHLKGDKPIQFMGKAHGEDQGQQTRSTQPIHIVVTDTR
ncbi:MAG TPA: hypothetical protein VJV04_04915 [Nitrospiraceae bacterium]|nr:hypothetical protein [Nitrospiraceae bacterium]